MSFPCASDGRNRATGSESGDFSPNSPSPKVRRAWNSVRSNLKTRTSISMPDLKRWLSLSRTSESDSPPEEYEYRPGDKEPGFFCDSLLSLMQQTGRFDHLDYTKDTNEKGKDKEKEKEKGKGREKEGRETFLQRPSKRFSWSR